MRGRSGRRPAERRGAARRGRRRGRLAADRLDLVAAALLVPLLGGAVDGAAVRTVTVATVVWGAAPAPAGAAATGGPLALPWSSGGPTADALVDVVVTGDVGIASVDLRLDVSDPGDGPAVTVTACVDGTWDGGTCTGAAVPLGDLTAATTLEVALEPGGRVALRAEARRNVANRTTFTLTVAVPRSAVRPGAPRSG